MVIEQTLKRAVLTNQYEENKNKSIEIQPNPEIKGTVSIGFREDDSTLMAITVNIRELKEVVKLL